MMKNNPQCSDVNDAADCFPPKLRMSSYLLIHPISMEELQFYEYFKTSTKDSNLVSKRNLKFIKKNASKLEIQGEYFVGGNSRIVFRKFLFEYGEPILCLSFTSIAFQTRKRA